MIQIVLIMVATIGIAVGFGAIAIGVFRVLSARKEQQREAAQRLEKGRRVGA
jgi:hypothetical protein